MSEGATQVSVAGEGKCFDARNRERVGYIAVRNAIEFGISVRQWGAALLLEGLEYAFSPAVIFALTRFSFGGIGQLKRLL